MTAELQAFVHHLFIVGGRTISIPPPGALAELAPPRAARARAGDTFFILVTPGTGTHATAARLEELAQLGADVYFGSGGGITGGLREALLAIHAHARARSGTDGPLHVNAIALVLRDDQLYAARAGGAFGALVQPEGVRFLPADRRDPLEIGLPPLGAGSEPEIDLARFTLAPGQMVMVADTGLFDADDEALAAALQSADLDAAIGQLKALSGPSLSAIVIQFAPAGAPGPAHLVPQPSPRAPRQVPPPAVVSGPSRVPDTAPPLEQAAPAGEPAAPAPGPEPQPVEAAPRPAPPLPGFRVRPHEPPPASGESPAPAAGPVLRLPGVETGDLSGAASRAADRLRETWQSAAGRASTAAQVSRRRAPGGLTALRATVARAGRRALRAVLTGLLALFDALSRGLSAILPEPGEEGQQGIPTNVAVSMAIIIPVVIVVAVVGFALSQRGRSEFEEYYQRARDAHAQAIELSGTTGCPANTRPKWEEVLWLADRAREFRPDDLNVLQIRADAINYLDCFDRVQRRDLTVLHEFGEQADLAGPIVHNGVELYVLDRRAGAIYHDTLNETGTGLTSRGDTPIIRRGQAIGGFTVGEIFDIEWLRSGGTTHDNVLIALDRNGVLIAHSWTFAESAQQLVIEQRWVNPVAMAVFRENLYVLDTGANQIWRYVPPAGERRYSNAPEEYFTGADRPDLSDAVDLGISETGEVFVLFRDGTIQRYLSGKPQEFVYSLKPEGALQSGRALFVDNDREARTLFIVDPETETIYETSWAGTFQRGFRPRNLPDAFEKLSGFYADAVERNNMYVLAGNKLYHFRRN